MYTKTDWNIGATPAINETNLDKIEGGIERAHLGTHIYGLNATGNDTYVLTFSPSLGSYNTGLIINLAIDTANTGAATLNINSLGAKDIKKRTVAGKVALITGDLTVAGIYTLIYDGTDFVVINPNLPVGLGTAYQQLGTNAGATANEFQNSATSILAAAGDTLHASAANTLAKLAKGAAYKTMRMNSAGTLPEWGTNIARGVTVLSQSQLTDADYLEQIALGFPATRGRVFVYNTSHVDFWTLIFFDTITANAYALGSDLSALVNGDLGNEFSSASNNTKITTCSINGTNLEINFHNYGANTRTTTATMIWEVEI